MCREVTTTTNHPVAMPVALAATIGSLTQADKIFFISHAVNDGIPQYDILVLLPGRAQLSFRHYHALVQEHCREYGTINLWCCHSAAARRHLYTGHIFYSLVCTPGRLLHDGGYWPLANYPVNTENVVQQARLAFAPLFATARSFLDSAAYAAGNGRLPVAAFLLHQATEQALRALLYPVMGYNGRGHRLDHWLHHCNYFTPSLRTLFPRDTDDEKHLFHLLDDAYLHARYRQDYTLSPAEAATLLHRVERLHTQVQQIFETQLITFQSSVTCKTKSS
jgi:uncharacterized protein